MGDAITHSSHKKCRMLPETCSSIDNKHKKSTEMTAIWQGFIQTMPRNWLVTSIALNGEVKYPQKKLSSRLTLKQQFNCVAENFNSRKTFKNEK
jgi:hypothetical protein